MIREMSWKKEKTKRRVGEIRAEATDNLFHISPQKQKHILVCAVETMEVSGSRSEGEWYVNLIIIYLQSREDRTTKRHPP